MKFSHLYFYCSYSNAFHYIFFFLFWMRKRERSTALILVTTTFSISSYLVIYNLFLTLLTLTFFNQKYFCTFLFVIQIKFPWLPFIQLLHAQWVNAVSHQKLTKRNKTKLYFSNINLIFSTIFQGNCEKHVFFYSKEKISYNTVDDMKQVNNHIYMYIYYILIYTYMHVCTKKK